MRFVIQRVREASVSVDGKVIGKIDHGLLVFVGVADGDNKEIADKMTDKMTKLRIFDDADGKTNLSSADVNGAFVCGLQKGKQAVFYACGETRYGRSAV